MRASSVDDWWEILAAEHRAQGHDVPKLDRFLYRLALACYAGGCEGRPDDASDERPHRWRPHQI